MPAMADRGPEPEAAEMEAATIADFVSTVETSVNTAFVIQLPYTVASSNKPTLVDIARHELPAMYQYVVAPKLDPDAFLVARGNVEVILVAAGLRDQLFGGTT